MTNQKNSFFNSVLIVEDDAADRFIIKRNIQQFSPDTIITEYSNPVEALSFLNALNFDKIPQPELIFLDINLPLLDGFAFLEAFEPIRKRYQKHCVVAVITGAAKPLDKERALRFQNVVQFIEKPVTQEHVRMLAESWKIQQAS